MAKRPDDQLVLGKSPNQRRTVREVEKPGGNMIDEAYYKYLPVAERRLKQAGVRLAGVLNNIFKNGLPASAAPGASPGPAWVILHQ